MPRYRVIIDDKVVWENKVKSDIGTIKEFPPEYLQRPESGSVTLMIDDEIVGVQVSEEDEDKAAKEVNE